MPPWEWKKKSRSDKLGTILRLHLIHGSHTRCSSLAILFPKAKPSVSSLASLYHSIDPVASPFRKQPSHK